MDAVTQKNKTPVIKILIVVAVLLAFGGYIYTIEKDTKETRGTTLGNSKEEAKQLAEIVSKLVLVDKNQVPEIVTISDAETMVKQQPVFRGVVNGDKILVYVQDKKAIVYSPSRKIIVNILPITMQKQPVDTMVQQATTTPVKASVATTTKAKK